MSLEYRCDRCDAPTLGAGRQFEVKFPHAKAPIVNYRSSTEGAPYMQGDLCSQCYCDFRTFMQKDVTQ